MSVKKESVVGEVNLFCLFQVAERSIRAFVNFPVERTAPFHFPPKKPCISSRTVILSISVKASKEDYL